MRVSARLRLTLVIIGVMAAACSRVPPGSETTLGSGPGFGSNETAGLGADGRPLDSAAGADGVGTLGDPSGASGRGAGAGGGAASGAGGGDGSSAAGPGVPTASVGGPSQGIDYQKREIKVVFPHKAENCGDDQTTAGQGTSNQKGRDVLDTYVKFFNDEVLKPYNWKLVYEMVDDGGLYCPEKMRAGALKIVKEIRPFAVLGGEVSIDQGPITADTATRAGIIHIGRSWGTYDEIRARHPLAWELGPVAQRLYDDHATWMVKRVKGTKVKDINTGLDTDRVYGLIAVDLPEMRKVASIMKARLAEGGINLSKIYFVSPDPGVAAQTAATTVQKMKADNVNTLIFDFNSVVNGGQAALVYTNNMSAQNYLPDLLLPGVYGNPFFERLFDNRVWSKARGTSSFAIITLRLGIRPSPNGGVEVDPRYEEINENQSGYDLVWRRAGNNSAAQDASVPQAFATWSELSLLAQGIMHAGPELNVATWANGMQASAVGGPNRCGVERLIGRDYLYNPVWNWDNGHDGGLEGFTTIYWVNKQTPLGTNGYYESYDNYQYFNPANPLPDKPIHDTGQDENPNIPKQERIGLRPWTPCSQFGLKD